MPLNSLGKSRYFVDKPSMSAQGILKPGMQLGKLLVEGQIGTDSAGELYTGIIDPAKARAVVRVLAPKITENKALLQDITAEIKRYTACKHAHLAQVLVFSQVPTLQRWLLVTSLGEAIPFRERLSRRSILPADVVPILKQALSAMQCAHEHGFVHGDINLDNLVIDADGKVKIANFAFFGRSPEDRKAHREFQAPELGKTQEPSVLTDVYSLGIVFRILFESIGKSQVPAEIRGLADRMTAKKPKKRLQSMAEAIAELAEIAPENAYANAQRQAARSYEKSRTIQLQVDRELRRAALRAWLPSPLRLIVLGALVYYFWPKLEPMIRNKSFTEIASAVSREVAQSAKKIANPEKPQNLHSQALDTRKNAEKSMLERGAVLDQMFIDDEEPRKK